MLKVLIQSYNTCCQNESGGVQNRIRKIYSLLSDKVKVDYFNQFTTKLTDYDILHVFSLQPENISLIVSAKKLGLKVVISSIVNLTDAKKIYFYTYYINKLPIMNVYKENYISLQLADAIIVETKQEKEFLHKVYKTDISKCWIIPNGIDPIDYSGDCIFDVIGGRRKYILQVGRFDKNKNQLSVIKALKGSEYCVVFIGGSDHTRESAYYSNCIKEAKNCKNIFFLGWQLKDSDILRSAYANAEVVIVPSFQETFGLTLLEGGYAGAKLAISKTLPILDYDVFDECRTFSPGNIKDLKNAVIKAFNDEKDNNFSVKLASVFSWENVINEHLNCYKHIMNRGGKKNDQNNSFNNI